MGGHDIEFHVADYIVFGFSILISLGIGVYYGIQGRRKQTTEEYLVGSRNMKMLPVAMSLVVTFESSIFMMGVPAEVYFYGFQSVLMSFAWLFNLIFAAYVYVPMIHALKLTSAFEYLELRFGKRYVRVIGSVLQILYNLIYMGIVLYGPALVLEGALDVPRYASVLFIGIISVIYTSVGGMKAVVWTDFFQFTVMFIGMIVVLIKGSLDIGGASEVFRRSYEHGRLFVDFSFDPRVRLSFWIAIFGNTFRTSGLAFQQSSVQRIASLPTERSAKLCLLVAAPWFMLLSFMACTEGLVAYAYYDYHGCDPLASGKITNENQLIIVLVLQIFKKLPGMAGLFIAALFSASLSTLSSCLSSVAANVWEDILKHHVGNISDWLATLITKVSVIITGVAAIALCFVIAEIGGTLVRITSLVLSLAIGPMAGLYLLGVLFPCANAKGVTVGSIISLIISSWLAFGKSFTSKVPTYLSLPPASTNSCSIYNDTTTVLPSMYSTITVDLSTPIPEPESDDLGLNVIYTLSPYVYGPLFCLLSIVLGLVCSLILQSKLDTPVDPAYITPLVRPLWRSSRYLKHDDYKLVKVGISCTLEKEFRERYCLRSFGHLVLKQKFPFTRSQTGRMAGYCSL